MRRFFVWGHLGFYCLREGGGVRGSVYPLRPGSMDERFYTPRASCTSSRSNGSFTTPRANLLSNRSMSSSDSESVYRTPRSTQNSPAEPMGVHGHHRAHGRHRTGGHHDRSRDFRRFSVNVSSSRQPALASMPPSSYSSAGNTDFGALSATVSHEQIAKTEHNRIIFSLSRHGREGEVEELLLQGNKVGHCK